MEKQQIITPVFNENEMGIGIDEDTKKLINLGDIKKINYPNFKYEGITQIQEDESKRIKKVHFIRIANIPKNLIREIANTINDWLNHQNLSANEAFNKILDYFKKVEFKKRIVEKICGDIGEAFFIIKALENNINSVSSSLRRNDNDLYDFHFNNLDVEIKSSSLEKNQFIMTHEQLEQSKNKKIVIVKFKKIKGEKNILDLYDIINEKLNGHLPDLLKEKYAEWKEINACSNDESINDIINDYTVNLDLVKIALFKDNNLPDIEIIDKRALKKIKYYIDCSDSQLEKIDKLWQSIKQL